MTITRAMPAADCDHRLRAAIGGGASPCGAGAGPLPSAAPMDELLDERLAHRSRAGEHAAVGT
jgi:hypothetical protein